jgi:lipopolysaccharide/colanic/teichoic acid biosynthesis glycosyltransferase
MKRIVDVVGALVLAVMAAPLVAVLAVAIRLESRGPALYRQLRVGRGGRLFTLFKLRSMRVDADVEGPAITVHGDARITRVGSVIRRFKLDELPQLLNVLRGEMSLVGPRPEVPRYVAQYLPADAAVVLSVRPGLTDPASVILFDESELLRTTADPERFYIEQLIPYKIGLYRRYVASQSLAGDLAVLAKTLARIVGISRPPAPTLGLVAPRPLHPAVASREHRTHVE